jgi:hypothetical protein
MSLADPAVMLMKLGMFRVDRAALEDKTVADAAIPSMEDIENFIRFLALFFHLSAPVSLNSFIPRSPQQNQGIDSPGPLPFFHDDEGIDIDLTDCRPLTCQA